MAPVRYVLFCKVKLSKMTSTKTNATLVIQVFELYNFDFGSKKIHPPLKVFKMYFVPLTPKQNCITQKVGLEKCCLFLDFVCFSGRHFTQPGFTEKDIVQNFFFDSLHFCLTFLHHISKIWRRILQFRFKLIFARCETFLGQKGLELIQLKNWFYKPAYYRFLPYLNFPP